MSKPKKPYWFGPQHWDRETAIEYYHASQRALREQTILTGVLRTSLLGLMTGDNWLFAGHALDSVNMIDGNEERRRDSRERPAAL